MPDGHDLPSSAMMADDRDGLLDVAGREREVWVLGRVQGYL
jgi:hypothetical protein